MSRTLRLLIEHLLSGGSAEHTVRCYGASAVPALMAALQDPRALQGRYPPLISICRLLAPYEPKIALHAILDHVDSFEFSNLKAAVQLIISIGSAEGVKVIARLMSTSPPQHQEPIRSAIWAASRSQKFEPSAMRPLLELLLPRLSEAPATELRYLAETLLACDPDRALDEILKLGMLSPTHAGFRDVLEALHTRRVPVPPDALVEVSEWLGSRLNDFSLPLETSCIVQYGLPVLARCLPSAIESLARAALVSPNPLARWGGAEAIAVIYRVEDARVKLDHKLFENDPRKLHKRFSKLTEPQQIYVLAFDVDVCATMNGMETFLWGAFGRYYREAIRALNAIEAPQAARILESAIDVFGPGGPPDDVDTFLHSEAGRETRQRLRAADKYLQRHNEPVLDLLKLYAAKHAEDFR